LTRRSADQAVICRRSASNDIVDGDDAAEAHRQTIHGENAIGRRLSGPSLTRSDEMALVVLRKTVGGRWRQAARSARYQPAPSPLQTQKLIVRGRETTQNRHDMVSASSATTELRPLLAEHHDREQPRRTSER